MSLKSIVLGIIMLMAPVLAMADRYGISEQYEEPYEQRGSINLNKFFGFIIVLAGGVAAYSLLCKIHKERNRNSAAGKIQNDKKEEDRIATFFVQAVIAIFASLPVILAIKLLGGVAVVKEYWPWVYAASLGVVIYITRK